MIWDVHSGSRIRIFSPILDSGSRGQKGTAVKRLMRTSAVVAYSLSFSSKLQKKFLTKTSMLHKKPPALQTKGQSSPSNHENSSLFPFLVHFTSLDSDLDPQNYLMNPDPKR
jgi:hypothetical protein